MLWLAEHHDRLAIHGQNCLKGTLNGFRNLPV